MQIKTFVLSVLVAASAIAASAAEIDRVAAAMTGHEAQFTQRFTPKGFTKAQVESGTVVFGALPQMRWNYTTPEQKLFVFDGSRSWFYVPADRQVTIGRIDENRKRDLPFLLIGDPAARQTYFAVRENARGDAITTTLEPVDKNAMIRSIAIVSGAADHLIRSVEYTDREGNRTRFELSAYRPHSANASDFMFTPPAGVQVVDAQ